MVQNHVFGILQSVPLHCAQVSTPQIIACDDGKPPRQRPKRYILKLQYIAPRHAVKMMDILLSLPILSFFFSSATTSWSTSLNLLFFYLTWSTLILSHSPLHIQLFGTLAIRLLFFLLPSLLFLAFDSLLPSLAESIKHGGASSLPPRDPRVLAKVFLLAVVNLLLETALETSASLGLTYLFGRTPFTTTTTLPLPFAIIKQLGWLYLSREVLAYYLHRTVLHAHAPRWTRRLSLSSRSSSSSTAASRAGSKTRDATGYVARQHARHAHARSAAPYSLALAADHPLPFLLHRFVPVYLPAVLVHPHLLVYFIFVVLITIEETLTMSGYTIVPGFIMGGITRRNAVHYGAGHRGSDSGNYGAWGVLDWVGGTGFGGRDIEDDVRDGAAHHRVKERGERSANDAVEAVQNGVEGLRKGKGRGKGRKANSGSD